MTDKTEHFIPPAPAPEPPTTSLFPFTVDPLALPPTASELAAVPEPESQPYVGIRPDDDTVDRQAFDALLVLRADGGILAPKTAQRVLRLLIDKFKDRPFLLSDLTAADQSLPESSYESQLRVIGKRTGRLSHRPGGRGYPSTYLFHAPKLPLLRPSFHLNPAIPHAKELGAVRVDSPIPQQTKQEELPMSEPTSPPAPPSNLPPLNPPGPAALTAVRRRLAERAGSAKATIDPLDVLAAWDAFEELLADVLDGARKDLRKRLGLDT